MCKTERVRNHSPSMKRTISALKLPSANAVLPPDHSTPNTHTRFDRARAAPLDGLCDCENQLMELFDYQSHHIIQVFDERVNVEVAMREKGVGWILRELAGGKETKKESYVMGVDNTAKIEVPKTATLAPGSTVQPKRILDLESMAFSQGGHLVEQKVSTSRRLLETFQEGL